MADEATTWSGFVPLNKHFKNLLFPRTKPLEDTPKSRRLVMMRTKYNRPKCIGCAKKATYYSTLHKRYVCTGHLSKEDRKRLTMEWQWANIVLPIQRHVQLYGRG